MEPVIVGDVRARVVRSRGVRGPHDGRVYWRAELARRVVWVGWATREEAAVALAQLVAGGIEGARPKVADIRTVRDLLDYWVGTVTDRPDRARRTQLAERGAAKRLVRAIGDVRLDRMTRATLDDLVGRRLRAGDGAQTIRYDLRALSRAWQWGRELGATPDHDLPIPHVRPQPKRDKYTPTAGQVAAVVDWLAVHAPGWVGPLVLLGAATGARVGELAALTWDAVHWDEGYVVLTGKTGRRAVPVRRDVLDLVAGLPRTADGVWGVSSETADGAGEFVGRACAALGQPRWTMHGLRRLAVDTLLRSGTDVGTAAAWLGHSPAVMLDAYRQVSLDDLRAAAARSPLGVPTEQGRVIDLEARKGGR